MAMLAREQVRQRDEARLWAEYERRKRDWQRDNTEASHAEYERAMRRILNELGL